MSNAVEYVLGGSSLTKDLSKLPTPSVVGGNLLFTFQRSQASIDGSTVAVIEVGTDLVAWPSPSPYAIPDLAATNTPGVSVQKGVPTGFDTITLSLPQGLDSRKFVRLKVTIAP